MGMKKILFAFLAMAASVFSLSVHAQVGSEQKPVDAGHDVAACWKGASQYHGVDMWLLYSIGLVESGLNPKSVGRNKNGSTDLGMMQINTIWLKELGRYGIGASSLMEPCTSIYVGAWILSKNIKTYGYTWRAIGAYNSANPNIGFRYAQKVYATHHRITGVPTKYLGQAQ